MEQFNKNNDSVVSREDDGIINKSESSDNIERGEVQHEEEKKVEINYEEYVNNKIRELFENTLIDMAKKELSLNQDLKTQQDKLMQIREKTNLLMVGLQMPGNQ